MLTQTSDWNLCDVMEVMIFFDLNNSKCGSKLYCTCGLYILGATLLPTFSPEVTHVIVLANEMRKTDRTIKYLYGVSTGKWVVTYDWVVDSLKVNHLLPEVKILTPFPHTNPSKFNLILFQVLQVIYASHSELSCF